MASSSSSLFLTNTINALGIIHLKHNKQESTLVVMSTYLNLPSFIEFFWISCTVISLAVKPSELITSHALTSTQDFPFPDWQIPNNDIPPFSCVTNAVFTPSSSNKGGISL